VEGGKFKESKKCRRKPNTGKVCGEERNDEDVYDASQHRSHWPLEKQICNPKLPRNCIRVAAG
jgi:hypothetical protein